MYAKKDGYYLYIRVSSRRRFAELIGFTIRRKMERLMKALNPPPFFPPHFSIMLTQIVYINIARGGVRTPV